MNRRAGRLVFVALILALVALIILGFNVASIDRRLNELERFPIKIVN